VNKIWQWVKGKFGRITTALGGLVTLADLDISPVKSLLEEVISHQHVVYLTLGLFVASYLRHHWVSTLHPTTP
jgi:hypothetical protein